MSESGFSAIKTPAELISYLTKPDRINNISVLHHYTSLNAVLGIIKSGYWVLQNPLKMNDALEIDHWEQDKLKKLFFISFMGEQDENIGMWSMYAQPWSNGVKVSIKKNALKKWVKSLEKIYKADPENYCVEQQEYIEITEMNRPRITAVAYTTCDNLNEAQEKLSWSTKRNDYLHNIYQHQELMGFIKNDAWLYEKEIRFRVDLDKEYPAIALKITDELLDGMTITAGPRFEGDLKEKIKQAVQSKSINTATSLFYNKITRIPCDRCKEKENKVI